MKYLVTGGAGFIGSNIVDRLVSAGHGVVVIDNESSDAHDYFYYNDKAKYYKHDICDHDKIKHLFKGVDTVFHCAAEARIQPAIKNPLLAVKTNSYGTCSVLQAARDMGVRRVVYSSTSSAYGLINEVPQVETQPDDCLNPYSVSKVSGEKLCKMYSDLFGLQTVIFRYFNVYGERQPLRGQYAPVVGLFLEQMKKGEPLTIVPDGEQRRDFTHVNDIVHGLIAMSKDEGNCSIYQLGTGKHYSINDLAGMFSDNIKYIPKRPGEAWITLADNSEAKQKLGWSPIISLEKYVALLPWVN